MNYVLVDGKCSDGLELRLSNVVECGGGTIPERYGWVIEGYDDKSIQCPVDDCTTCEGLFSRSTSTITQSYRSNETRRESIMQFDVCHTQSPNLTSKRFITATQCRFIPGM